MNNKERIKQDAERQYETNDTTIFNGMRQDAFVAGAISERNKAIQEAIDLIESELPDGWMDIIKKLESLKIKL
jgi:hypothetical protein